ncbi:MAG: UDP-glucose 4-epimerase GalE [Acidobacteria bacterium]|nr:UDP-glucose 4-epimerase GalE [Acidobacteriota bacterium]
MKVLVTGGAGYIGSVVVEKLVDGGHDVEILDNLSTGHREAVPEGVPLHVIDLLDRDAMITNVRGIAPDAVMHLAAVAVVPESVADPGKYFRQNVTGTINLLDAMVEAKVGKIIFSSTAAVYGEPEELPITEEAKVDPTNPYGESKLAVERMLRWYENAHDLRYGVLRYFNASGATERNGERREEETHLIPLVLAAATGSGEPLSIFGTDWDTRDGTCIRDYVHVEDLATAHLKLIPLLDRRSATYNLGCGGEGYTVREVIAAAEKVTGMTVPFVEAPRRPGDPAALVASSEKMKRETGWEPQHDELEKIVASAWEWMKKSEE